MMTYICIRFLEQKGQTETIDTFNIEHWINTGKFEIIYEIKKTPIDEYLENFNAPVV